MNNSRNRARPVAFALGGLSLAAAAALSLTFHAVAEPAVKVPAPVVDAPPATAVETIVLAGGCFWGVQGVFQHVKGVISAESGYSGGSKSTASYEIVSGGRTGHAESVRIRFDPHTVSYGKILQIYFSVVTNPTERDRQGPDVGTQYRSEIFTSNAGQRKVAQAYIAQLDKAHVFPRPIVTTVAPLKGFYPAEGYHQNFATLHPGNPYIAYNDLPKIANLKQVFPAFYRSKPTLVNVASATH